MLETWVFTVFSDRTSARAISRLERPSAISPSTSRSRSVRVLPRPVPLPVSSWASSAPATSGWSRTCPAWTERMAPARASGSTSLYT